MNGILIINSFYLLDTVREMRRFYIKSSELESNHYTEYKTAHMKEFGDLIHTWLDINKFHSDSYTETKTIEGSLYLVSNPHRMTAERDLLCCVTDIISHVTNGE